MLLVYKKKNFKIFAADKGYIIHNTKKPFQDGHTHINNYNTAKYLVDLSIHESMPHHLYIYFLVSLRRLSNSNSYSQKLDNLIVIKTEKKTDDIKYYNKPKHFKKKGKGR